MNITEPIRRSAGIAPHSIAIIHAGGVVSYEDLERTIDNLALRISGLGYRAGDVVGLLVGSRYGQLVFYLALARLGIGCTVSMEVVNGLGGAAVSACVIDSGAEIEVATGKIEVDSTWWQTPPAETPVPTIVSHENGDTACIITTSSGTTGVPKAIVCSQALMVLRISCKWLTFPLPSNSRLLCMAGLDTSWGLTTTVRVLWSGGFAVLVSNVRDACLSIQMHNLNYILASPAQLQSLVAGLPAHTGPFPSLELVESGGSALSPSLAKLVRARLCQNICVSYGSAESGPAAGAPLAVLEIHRHAVGFVSPGMEIQAVDANDLPLPQGDEGILRIRGDTCVANYLGDSLASAKAFKNGWFYPGDIGSVSANGLVCVVGRSNELINVGGVKISPLVIEEIVLACEEITEAAAFAASPNDSGLAEIWVAIVMKTPVDLLALGAACLEKLGEARAPKRFIPLSKLPRNDNGKILRDRLADLAHQARREEY